MSTFVTVLAQTAAPAPTAPGYGSMIYFLIACSAVFYFIVFRPQRREQAARKALLDGLAKHDKVLTHGGIYGTVVTVKEDRIEIKVCEANNTRITITKNAVSKVVEKKLSKQDKAKETAASK